VHKLFYITINKLTLLWLWKFPLFTMMQNEYLARRILDLK